MQIRLTEEEMERCHVFSKECAINQQAIEFGQRDTEKRSNSEVVRDNLIGKIAEVAFAKMLEEQYSIAVPLDFNYYPRGEWDGQDAVVIGWKTDVKATRSGGHWMLIEWNKLDFRQKGNDLSHLYVMASVQWDRKSDRPEGAVDLVGSTYINRLRAGEKNTVVLRKGDFIPGTQTPLQADNYGIEFNNLTEDWDRVLNYIREHEPPNTDEYPNPYTGKTTAEMMAEKNKISNLS